MTVYNRIVEINERMKTNDAEAIKATGCTALVVTDSIKQQLSDIQAFIDKTMNVRKGRGHSAISGAGTGAGRKAGESVKLNNSVQASRLAITKK